MERKEKKRKGKKRRKKSKHDIQKAPCHQREASTSRKIHWNSLCDTYECESEMGKKREKEKEKEQA